MSENLAARCADYGNLEEQVSLTMWPTPAARDYKGANSLEHCEVNGTGRKHMDQLPNAVAHGDKPEPSGALNPTWVEWLMGWPIGWTSMEAITDLDWRDWSVDPADDGENTVNWPTPKRVDGIVRHSKKWMEKKWNEGGDVDLTIAVKMNAKLQTQQHHDSHTPRVATGIKHRVGRLKAIGNGQVPQVAAMAWNILNK